MIQKRCPYCGGPPNTTCTESCFIQQVLTEDGECVSLLPEWEV